MADNLIQKNGESTWYVVKQIPKDVRRTLGNRSTFTKSLKTGLRSEAMKLRLYWLAQWEADIAAAREQKITAREQWRPELASKGMRLEQQIDASVLDAAKNPPKGLGGTAAEIYARSDKLDQEIQEFLREVQRLEERGATGLVERVRANLTETESTTMVDAVMRSGQLTRDVVVQLAEHEHKLSPLESE